MESLFIFPMGKHIINLFFLLVTITVSLIGLLRMGRWAWLTKVTQSPVCGYRTPTLEDSPLTFSLSVPPSNSHHHISGLLLLIPSLRAQRPSSWLFPLSPLFFKTLLWLGLSPGCYIYPDILEMKAVVFSETPSLCAWVLHILMKLLFGPGSLLFSCRAPSEDMSLSAAFPQTCHFLF